MSYITLIGAFCSALVIFTLGLFAWRQQLLDKRRFEVAEQLLVVFAKLRAAIDAMRVRHGYKGIGELYEEQEIDAKSETYAYDLHMAQRLWIYRIPPKVAEETATAFKEYEPTRALAQMYMPRATSPLLQLEIARWRVEEAARKLPTINPTPSIDPQAPDAEGRTLYYDDSDDLPMAEQVALERKHFPDRFEDNEEQGAFDPILQLLRDAENDLELSCSPYKDQNPYRFLWRLLVSLEPTWITRPCRQWRNFTRWRVKRRQWKARVKAAKSAEQS